MEWKSTAAKKREKKVPLEKSLEEAQKNGVLGVRRKEGSPGKRECLQKGFVRN